MQDAVDFNDILTQAVNGQKGQPVKYELASIFLAPLTSTIRNLGERIHAMMMVSATRRAVTLPSCSSM